MRTLNLSLYISILIFVAASIPQVTAQVYFKLSMTPDEKTYIVSMIPETSLDAPMNMVSTSQVTIKLPADNNFVVSNVRTNLENVVWQESYVAERPHEAPEHEYISFGLITLAAKTIPFRFGEEVELFRFDNVGDCPGEVQLVDNFADPFIYPNTKSVSISNGITVLGLGTQAYFGNVENGSVNCVVSSNKEEEIIQLEESISLSPNPTTDAVNFTYGNNERFENQKLLIYNIDGRLLLNENIDGEVGNHQMDIDVKDWNAGSYLLYIENDKGTTRGTRFVKVSA